MARVGSSLTLESRVPALERQRRSSRRGGTKSSRPGSTRKVALSAKRAPRYPTFVSLKIDQDHSRFRAIVRGASFRTASSNACFRIRGSRSEVARRSISETLRPQQGEEEVDEESERDDEAEPVDSAHVDPPVLRG